MAGYDRQVRGGRDWSGPVRPETPKKVIEAQNSEPWPQEVLAERNSPKRLTPPVIHTRYNSVKNGRQKTRENE